VNLGIPQRVLFVTVFVLGSDSLGEDRLDAFLTGQGWPFAVWAFAFLSIKAIRAVFLPPDVVTGIPRMPTGGWASPFLAVRLGIPASKIVNLESVKTSRHRNNSSKGHGSGAFDLRAMNRENLCWDALYLAERRL
jgi:hypothetical protein